MDNEVADGRHDDQPLVIERWPTGAKLFLILSIALLPLAIIAIFATLQTTQVANTEARARLRVAAAESSRALAIELVGDMTALRAAVDALAVDPGNAPSCARVQGVFAQQVSSGTRFVIFDGAGRVLCGEGFEGASGTVRARGDPMITVGIVPDKGLALGVSSRTRMVHGAVFFRAGFLDELSRPSGFATPYAAALRHGDELLILQDLDTEGTLERRSAIRTDLGVGELALEMQVRSLPISSPMVIAMMLPLLMWAAAAGIAWFVVDRLLIRPLRRLRSSMVAFTPGGEIDIGAAGPMPAQEIRELGDAFRVISRTVALHEAGLAEGLIRQTKLTREVHHRVKNNLQVISSLINFHARGAKTPETGEAYASIQRRVDALAVVHRNHFAEMEENSGLGLRAVLGELASNLRATAPEGTALGITIDVDPSHVTQDVAVAVAFLTTEIVELALECDDDAKLRISVKPDPASPSRAILRVSSPALIACDAFAEGIATRYGRVMEGLSRQLRSKLHHDPLVGAYEISIAILSPA